MQSYQSPEVARAAETIFNGWCGSRLVIVNTRRGEYGPAASGGFTAGSRYGYRPHVGGYFLAKPSRGLPVFAFLGLRFFFCGAAAAAVLSRLPRGEATLAADDDRRAVVCAEPVSVDLLGLDHRLAGRGGVHHEPVDAVCAAHRMGDDENTPGPGILGVPAGRDRRPRAAESAYADCLPPQPGLVFC
ncbi:Uncharacterised protein [Raoultella ornithinolytica]|nr:Uncharacterised protein [Raoultella ornithinolytica]